LDSERSLRACIVADLPAEAFARRPWRLLLLVPLLAFIVGGTVAVIIFPLPWYAALMVSVLVGSLYASTFFLGHEVGHGAVVRPDRLRHAVLYITCLIYCLSPHLWMVWHNRVHHGYTNVPEHDPDTFGTLAEFRLRRFSQVIGKFAPGSGHVLSTLYLFTFFTLQAQGVLWVNSFRPSFRGLNRRRAIVESAAMIALWIGTGITAGSQGALFAVVIPMAMANFVIMSYVVTQHMLRPLADGADSLRTTMSVSTFRFLDLLFFNNSHHAEHHLFPSMSPRYYPLVRSHLYRQAADRYLAPSHWRALLLVFLTPRLYADSWTLVQPGSGHLVPILAVETALRTGHLRPMVCVSREAS
jgi:fatty acid desaturase